MTASFKRLDGRLPARPGRSFESYAGKLLNLWIQSEGTWKYRATHVLHRNHQDRAHCAVCQKTSVQYV